MYNRYPEDQQQFIPGPYGQPGNPRFDQHQGQRSVGFSQQQSLQYTGFPQQQQIQPRALFQQSAQSYNPGGYPIPAPQSAPGIYPYAEPASNHLNSQNRFNPISPSALNGYQQNEQSYPSQEPREGFANWYDVPAYPHQSAYPPAEPSLDSFRGEDSNNAGAEVSAYPENNKERDHSESQQDAEDQAFIEEALRQRPDAQAILRNIKQSHSDLYTTLRHYGMHDQLIDYVFFFMINYTIDQREKSQNAAQIYRRFKREMPWFNMMFQQYKVPQDVIDRTMTRVIQITLDSIHGGGAGAPGRPEQPGRGWSRWEDLGGVLSSAPTVSSWSANRLDVFGRGTDNALYHKWWDGSRWSGWENLGGVLSSAPSAVSWGTNRIDVFGRGTDNALYHKWWDGSRWSGWENLGGVLTSGPTVSTRRENQLDVFVRGSNNRLYKKTWNGSRWEDWEDLGGNLNSEPAAISWGPNRIDVFARAQNNGLLHRHWNGSRWSNWTNLGGNIHSAPAASSRRPNEIDVFARGRNNELLHRMWNGSRWTGWETLRGPITSAPAAVSWSANRIDVFARGQNNSLIHTYQGR
ncbi:hypothetical protein QR721_12975 [Aciduricibacillus chroicocephali]|uniref:PLL-like beta propeller domain-containing protein n=1 Tax=Aciduricibacillus chroicocephali TaxID=3054939 RepID=A0ABY9KUW2_9BACI|nr:hypothetical protein QR721_12975 [Bacillaceae bacterium 44XB]